MEDDLSSSSGCALQQETSTGPTQVIEVVEVVDDIRCETCRYIANQRQKLLLRSATVVFLLLELVLAFACFAIEVGFEIGGRYLRYYVRHPAEKNVHLMVTRTRLTYMTTAAVGLIFVPLILISLALTRKFCIFSFMCFLIGIVGFITFLAVGVSAFIHHDLPDTDAAAFQALAGCALATAILFLVHVIYEVWKFFFRPYPY